MSIHNSFYYMRKKHHYLIPPKQTSKELEDKIRYAVNIWNKFVENNFRGYDLETDIGWVKLYKDYEEYIHLRSPDFKIFSLGQLKRKAKRLIARKKQEKYF